MSSTPADPDLPQPRDIAVEQPTPDQLDDLERRSDDDEPATEPSEQG